MHDSVHQPDASFKLSIHQQIGINQMLLGQFIAEGCGRAAYVHGCDKSLVVKLAKNSDGLHDNIIEYQVWTELQRLESPLKKWLAPISCISANGTVLVMKRTTPLINLPKKLPSFLADIKMSNLGVIDGQVVAHDYANNDLFMLGAKASVLVSTAGKAHNGAKSWKVSEE